MVNGIVESIWVMIPKTEEDRKFWCPTCEPTMKCHMCGYQAVELCDCEAPICKKCSPRDCPENGGPGTACHADDVDDAGAEPLEGHTAASYVA